MADNTATAGRKVEGHRRAIQEHIEKYKKYKDENDKRFALKTIANAQRQIADIRTKHPSIRGQAEDSWRP